jgi:hypothetical protein
MLGYALNTAISMDAGALQAHELLVAKSKMMLVLSLNALNRKRDNRLCYQYQIA